MERKGESKKSERNIKEREKTKMRKVERKIQGGKRMRDIR